MQSERLKWQTVKIYCFNLLFNAFSKDNTSTTQTDN